MSYTICSRFKGEHIVYAGYTICTSREHIVYGAFCGSTLLSVRPNTEYLDSDNEYDGDIDDGLTQCERYIWASTRQNLSSGFPTKRVSNQSPQLQRLARILKFHL